MKKAIPRPRPKSLPSRTHRFEMGCRRNLYVTVTKNGEDQPFEVFIKMGKAGDCFRSFTEALGIAISLYLRAAGDPMKLAESLKNIRCPYSVPNPNEPQSCADAIAMVLMKESGGSNE